MTLVRSIPIILVFILLLTAFPGNLQTAAAQTACAQPLTSAVTQGSWSADCPSTQRDNSYARAYTFSLSRQSDVTIELQSQTDTYLYLLSGTGTSATYLDENDDIDTDGRNYNSRITRTLAAGSYTIEATTYDKRATGDFTLTVAGIDFSGTPPPTPSPTACVQAVTPGVTQGSWIADCLSTQRDNSYARAYTFSLSRQSDVTIELQSQTDTYLYLLSGTGASATYLDENDDIDTDGGNYNSRITKTLAAGDYTIEATTYDKRATGDFTLTVAVTDSTAPAPVPTPSPIPTPAPSDCTQSISAGASVQDEWTSGCVSRNRTEDGEYYAKYYAFTLDRTTTVEVLLESRTDSYIFLLDSAGEIVVEEDDYKYRNAGFLTALQPGAYTIEATTYSTRQLGDFTLSLEQPELDALKALYSATNGANWTNNDNWLSAAPISEWHGIKTDDEGHVTEIYLIDNNLSGTIPRELGTLSKLQWLFLARNGLSGSIPQDLGNLSNLRILMLSSNELTGSIPARFGNMAALEELHLGRNKLSGNIPASLGRLENLRGLHLTVNELSGRIPDELANLSSLRTLSIGANDLSGPIPYRLTDLENLTHIYLWNNDLTEGAFVFYLNDLESLQFLDIGGNDIEGAEVLAELAGLPNLTGLGLHDSGITDADLLNYMSDLQSLELEFLNIRSNGLSNPQTLIGLSRITSIQRLAINDNRFSGSLPRTMTNMTLMRLFYFHDNAGLCAPADSEFQEWLSNIRRLRGDTCTDGTPANAPTSESAGQFAAALQTTQELAAPQSPESSAQPHSLDSSLDNP